MNERQDIDAFVAQKTIAVAGISRDPKSFSRTAYRELKARGYRVLAVNPHAQTIDGDACYPSVGALPEKAGGVLIFTQPAETEKVAKEAVAAGTSRLWIQQGAQSEAAIRFCRDNALPAVWNRCIMMFLEPVGSVHAVHRWFASLFGAIPR